MAVKRWEKLQLSFSNNLIKFNFTEKKIFLAILEHTETQALNKIAPSEKFCFSIFVRLFPESVHINIRHTLNEFQKKKSVGQKGGGTEASPEIFLLVRVLDAL